MQVFKLFVVIVVVLVASYNLYEVATRFPGEEDSQIVLQKMPLYLMASSTLYPICEAAGVNDFDFGCPLLVKKAFQRAAHNLEYHIKHIVDIPVATTFKGRTVEFTIRSTYLDGSFYDIQILFSTIITTSYFTKRIPDAPLNGTFPMLDENFAIEDMAVMCDKLQSREDKCAELLHTSFKNLYNKLRVLFSRPVCVVVTGKDFTLHAVFIDGWFMDIHRV